MLSIDQNNRNINSTCPSLALSLAQKLTEAVACYLTDIGINKSNKSYPIDGKVVLSRFPGVASSDDV